MSHRNTSKLMHQKLKQYTRLISCIKSPIMASTTKIFHHSLYSTIDPSNPANDQTGRIVLIVGASSGIGFAIAQAYIQAKAAHVILTGRRQEALDKAITRLGRPAGSIKVTSYAFDISDESSITGMWKSLANDHVSVKTIILNAADSRPGPVNPIQTFLPQLRAALNTNLFAHLAMVEHFLAQTAQEGQVGPKVILNISSFMAHSNPAPFQATYSTSKAALTHTLQHLADEIKPEECQIINIHPGAILTESVDNAPQEMKDAVVWDKGK